jgi:hypothetical protein
MVHITKKGSSEPTLFRGSVSSVFDRDIYAFMFSWKCEKITLSDLSDWEIDPADAVLRSNTVVGVYTSPHSVISLIPTPM